MCRLQKYGVEESVFRCPFPRQRMLANELAAARFGDGRFKDQPNHTEPFIFVTNKSKRPPATEKACANEYRSYVASGNLRCYSQDMVIQRVEHMGNMRLVR